MNTKLHPLRFGLGLKTKLVVAIASLVFAMVGIVSVIYLLQSLRSGISQSYDSSDLVAHQVWFRTVQVLKMGLSPGTFNQDDPADVRRAVGEALRNDQPLLALIDSVTRYSSTIYDISIADKSGRALVTSDPSVFDAQLPERADYQQLRDGGLETMLSAAFGAPRVYNVTVPLDRNGQPFLTVRVGIRTTLLRARFEPWFLTSLTLTGIAMITALVVAAALANLALQPLENVVASLDALALPPPEVRAIAGRLAPPGITPEIEPPLSDDAVLRASHSIERLGRRMKNVEEVFSALKENLDQILFNLQDGILLFTRDSRAILVSSSVERFLGRSRDSILGSHLNDIFNSSTVLGRIVREAFSGQMSLVQEELTTESGRQLELSVDFIHDDGSHHNGMALGALVTLHDMESVREIENELEFSRRLAAIGRLTSGVGHEVKNPINAIVLHMELLRSKLNSSDERALRHLDIIQSEIQRLDRVVQTLVDFSRPVELNLREHDLRNIVSGVIQLASAELSSQRVHVNSFFPVYPVTALVDSDLLRQALLNVVLNGAQAMPEGGLMQIRIRDDSRIAYIEIQDEGEGIPEELRARIFQLYFTTKKEGSGIGLAMTYRIMQLHNGSVEVESKLGTGTTFSLALPVSHSFDPRTRGQGMAKPAMTGELKS